MRMLLVIVCLGSAACAEPRTATLVIRTATIVNLVDGSLRPDQTVLIQGNRIVTVGRSADVRGPRTGAVLDAQGGYLIPGLWDAHVHSAGNASWHLPLLLAYGVTSVRNMHTTADSPLALTNAIKRRVARGELIGPRLLANGPILDGEPPTWEGTFAVRSEAEARAAVDSLARGGADFIKVYDNLRPEVYFAIMDQARRRRISVDGHVPFRLRPEEVFEAGQRTAEHLLGMTFGCATAANAIRKERERLTSMSSSLSFSEHVLLSFRHERALHDSRDPDSCEATARAYRSKGVAEVPTLVIGHNNLNATDVLADSASMRLIPEDTRHEWQGRANSALSREIGALMRPVESLAWENVRLLNQAGVSVLAGTDLGNSMLVPGLSLHQELVLLVEAGLSPLEALRAATLNPARVFGLADSLGAIAAG